MDENATSFLLSTQPQRTQITETSNESRTVQRTSYMHTCW